MNLKNNIRRNVKILLDKRYIRNARKYEMNKFNAPVRKKIWQNVVLTDKQKRDIDEVFISNYGQKIPYIWHRHFMAFTGKFDKYYFPELLYIPEFEHFENLNPAYEKVLSDKNLLSLIACNLNTKMGG